MSDLEPVLHHKYLAALESIKVLVAENRRLRELVRAVVSAMRTAAACGDEALARLDEEGGDAK